MNNHQNRNKPIPDHFWTKYQKHREFIEKRIIKPMLSGANVFDVEAEDICHDVFLKYYKYLHSSQKEIKNELGLLITIAKCLTRNVIKRSKKLERLEDPDLHPGPNLENDYAEYDRKRLRIELFNLLKEHFPNNARRDYKIILRRLRDMKYEEITRLMKLSMNIVEDVLHRKFRRKILPLLQQRLSDQ
jgi:DNA-directed RNA polymerase specialized sigma24 family protein